MKLYLKYLKKYRFQVAAAILLAAASTVCELLLPTIMTDILNNGVYNADLRYILACGGKMLLVSLIGLVSVVCGTWFSSRAVSGMGMELRRDLFCKANRLTFEEIGAIGTGGLLSRSTHDIGTLSWATSMVSGSVITIPIFFIGGVVMCMRISLQISLIMLVCVPIVFLCAIAIGKKVLPLWEVSDRYIDIQNNIIRERLHGIRVIRAFNREPHEQERAADATRVMAENIIRANVAMGLVSPLAMGIMNLAAVLMVYVGARSSMQPGNGITGADVFAVVQYAALVMNGILIASFAIIMLPRMRVAIKRISEITDAEGIVESDSDALPDFRGGITVDNVTFYYEGASDAAVSGVSMHVEPGQNVAIIGGTGSGKSTLGQLLLRFRAPSEGRILFDSVDIASVSGRAVREKISCALQKAAVYSGTVRMNLLMGKPDATEEELWHVLKIAQMDEFVRGLPEGLDYRLEQSGKNLSGGQKQRLSIARALLKDAQVYLFDDSFSALDFLTESRLRKALNEEYSGKTRITVTQRISTAMASDLIFVMDRGYLIDSGTHEELLERCSVYREIYVSQTGGERE